MTAVNKKIFWITGLGFGLLNGLLIAKELYIFPLISAGLLLTYLAFFNLEFLFFLITFVTPLSILFDYKELGVSFTLPTEPILFGLMIFYWLKVIISGHIERKLLLHPLTVFIGLHLAWMGLTIISSSDPLVSFKFFLSNFWFVTVFYMIGAEVFKKRDNIQKFFWVYITPLAFVCLYTLVRHASYFFSHMVSSEVMQPFIENHAIYGAVLAIILCFLAVYLFQIRLFSQKPLLIIIVGILFIHFGIAMIFSYTRAAWLSLAAAAGFFVLLRLKVNFFSLIFMMTTLLLGFIIFQDRILLELKQNETDSSTKLDKHVQSISNIKTDASNLERLNRWACALRMFKERPFLGWGPGTYPKKYAPFQKPHEKTIISTNAGDVGGVHSEYLGPLVETGVPGFLIFIAMVLTILRRGMRLILEGKNAGTRFTALYLLLGLITYLSHGFLNNYLDIDKTASLFWASLGGIAALDIYHDKEDQKNDAKEIR